MKDKRYGEEGLWSLTELSGKPCTGRVILRKLLHLSCSWGDSVTSVSESTWNAASRTGSISRIDVLQTTQVETVAPFSSSQLFIVLIFKYTQTL